MSQKINVNIDISQILIGFAEIKSYQRAIFSLLTRDLTNQQFELIDLRRSRDFLDQLLVSIVADESENDQSAVKRLRNEIDIIDVRLQELDKQGVTLINNNQ